MGTPMFKGGVKSEKLDYRDKSFPEKQILGGEQIWNLPKVNFADLKGCY